MVLPVSTVDLSAELTVLSGDPLPHSPESENSGRARSRSEASHSHIRLDPVWLNCLGHFRFARGVAKELEHHASVRSRHLQLLERAGLVLSEPRRGFAFYRLSPDGPRLGRVVIGAAQAAGGR